MQERCILIAVKMLGWQTSSTRLRTILQVVFQIVWEYDRYVLVKGCGLSVPIDDWLLRIIKYGIFENQKFLPHDGISLQTIATWGLGITVDLLGSCFSAPSVLSWNNSRCLSKLICEDVIIIKPKNYFYNKFVINLKTFFLIIINK